MMSRLVYSKLASQDCHQDNYHGRTGSPDASHKWQVQLGGGFLSEEVQMESSEVQKEESCKLISTVRCHPCIQSSSSSSSPSRQRVGVSMCSLGIKGSWEGILEGFQRGSV